MQANQRWRALLSTFWFLLVAVAYYAPLLGLPLPMGAFTALYGLVLLTSSTVLALLLVAQKGNKKRVE